MLSTKKEHPVLLNQCDLHSEGREGAWLSMGGFLQDDLPVLRDGMAWESPMQQGAWLSSRRNVPKLLLRDVWCDKGGGLQPSLVSVFPQEVPEGPVPREWAVGRGTLHPRGV